jgi:hypothetical protein
MKKNFPLTEPGKADARVVEAVKNEVRKYVKRERRKPVPEGFDLWTFACRAGATSDNSAPCELEEVGRAIDAVASAGGKSVYIEILAAPGHRLPSAAKSAGA